MRESNSHQRFWRPLSYHLTNPLSKPTCKNFFYCCNYTYKSNDCQAYCAFFIIKNFTKKERRWRDLNPRTGCPACAFRVRSLQPLGYISILRLETVLKCNWNCFLLYKESTERSILFLLTNWFCCNKIITKCGCVPSGLLLSGDNKQLRGKQIGDDHDR